MQRKFPPYWSSYTIHVLFGIIFPQSILITREILLTSENTSIRLCAKQRQMCADDLREAWEKLQVKP